MRSGYHLSLRITLFLAMSFAATLVTSAAVPGTFSPAGNMIASRYQATVTMLLTGQVLIAGGSSSSGTTATAELYDPVAGTFMATGSMAEPRQAATATLLPGGKVLIASGGTANAQDTTAEIYDPATGTFSGTAGNMVSPRRLAAATLLANGKVLICGGYDTVGPGFLDSAELYDPASGTFAATNSMATARDGVSAVLLPNGKVLIAGGSNGGGAVASAELYDPVTGTFSPTGALTAARTLATATLLANDTVLFAGGSGTSGVLASAEVYDPATGAFTATGNLSTARYTAVASLLPGGKVLVAAGSIGGSAIASAELYDPASGTFAATGSMAVARAEAMLISLPGGMVLVIGGYPIPGYAALASAELYDAAPVDTTPPLIIAGIAGRAGLNGWYTSPVTVTWSALDPESPITSIPCTPTVLSADTAGTVVTCSATSSGGTATVSVTVKIDQTPPIVACTVSPTKLQPPNHKLVNIIATVNAYDVTSGIAGPSTLVSITSSEPNSGYGSNDVKGWTLNSPSYTGQLRATRNGDGKGRVYTLTYAAKDVAGNTGNCSVKVTVPRGGEGDGNMESDD